ncbi:MAG: hypothetical protein H7175_02135 [Burkholderiales bacterium]|nr:hypothetical protein [Anaerolineae bacterium]
MNELSDRAQTVLERLANVQQVKQQYMAIGLAVGLAIGLTVGVVLGLVLSQLDDTSQRTVSNGRRG